MLFSKISGTGTRQIIFVHGNSQSHETWKMVTTDEALMEYKLVTLDLPGHGQSFRSADPEFDYSLKGLGRHLNSFLSGYQAHEFILVGVSLGCNVIAEACPLHPNCKGVFLLGPQIIGSDLNTGDIIKPNPNIAAVFSPNPSDQELQNFLDDMACNISPELKEICKSQFLQTDPSFRQHFAESVSKQGWSEEIESLAVLDLPLAIIYGNEEKFVFAEYLNKIDLRKWRDEIIQISGAGHFAHLDQPDIVVDLIRDFAMECFHVKAN